MSGEGGGATQTRDNTYQVYDNVSWQKGRHLIKCGAEFMFIEYVPVTQPNLYGSYQFSSGQKPLRPPRRMAPAIRLPASCSVIPPFPSTPTARAEWTDTSRSSPNSCRTGFR